MRFLRPFAIAVLVSTSLSAPSPARAWGKYGHMTICDLAYRNFTGRTREKLKTLFAIDQAAGSDARVYRSFNYACLEEDATPRKHPNDHFINYARDVTSATGPACPSTTVSCVLAGIERDLKVLKDENQAPKKRARALMSIGHWVGDIHQPLHISFEDDRGGNFILVTGRCGTAKDMSLHSVWDNCLLEKGLFAQIKASPEYKKSWKRETITYRAVDRLRARETADAGLIRRWLGSSPWEWARESYALTLAGQQGAYTDNGYCFKQSGSCAYSPTLPKYGKGKDPMRTVDITDDYLTTFVPVGELRLRQAAYRLADMVNGALDTEYRPN